MSDDEIPVYPDPGPGPTLEERRDIKTNEELRAHINKLPTPELRSRLDKLTGLREQSGDQSYDRIWQVLSRRYITEELARREGT